VRIRGVLFAAPVLAALAGCGGGRQAVTVSGGTAPPPAPDPVMELLEAARTDRAAGRHAEAVARLEKARDEAAGGGLPVPPGVAAALALEYMALGDQDLAEETLLPLEPGGPHWRSVGSVLVYVALHGEDVRPAAVLARRALDAGPESAVNRNNLGITLAQAGDPVGAKAAFEEAIRIDPSLPGPMYNLALVEMFYFLNEEGAGEFYERYREMSNEDPDGLASFLGIEDPEESP
jgi:tetratricopeptide (TPR) repeat protein